MPLQMATNASELGRVQGILIFLQAAPFVDLLTQCVHRPQPLTARLVFSHQYIATNFLTNMLKHFKITSLLCLKLYNFAKYSLS